MSTITYRVFFFIAYAKVVPAAKKLISPYRRKLPPFDVPPCQWIHITTLGKDGAAKRAHTGGTLNKKVCRLTSYRAHALPSNPEP